MISSNSNCISERKRGSLTGGPGSIYSRTQKKKNHFLVEKKSLKGKKEKRQSHHVMGIVQPKKLVGMIIYYLNGCCAGTRITGEVKRCKC